MATHEHGLGPAPAPGLSATPSRAAFLSTGTADFHPPDWASMPIEANQHARLEAFRDSRHCATYMVSTKLVNVFGRDQENCDHVLGNPSVSRKHAAIVHDATGGIYLVDLMSRHGTYVKGKKLPPHDPFLLHDGDVIKFGQSIRVYILKGATAEGASAPVKKTWGRVKIKAPKISAVLPKMPSRPKYASTVVKLVNDVCYGNQTEDKLDTFITAVMELSDDEKRDVADLLIEKVQAKFEFYASHVHKNAYHTTVELLKRNLLVEEFEGNLSVITQLSQQRHDSIYRSNARKILQYMAAVRLDPDNVHSPVSTSYSVNDAEHMPDEINSCPPTTNHMGNRDRVLSGEGKRLFLEGHGYAPTGANGATRKNTEDYDVPHRSRQGSYGSTQYGDDDDETASQASSYQPPAPWQNGGYNPGHHQPYGNGTSNGSGGYAPQGQEQPSGFSFMANGGQTAASPSAQKPSGSAFGFIASTEPDDDEASTGRPSVTGFDFIAKPQVPTGPPVPRVRADAFLVQEESIDKDIFDEMWDSTTDSEEWVFQVPSTFDPAELQPWLERSSIHFVSSEKVSGMQQLLFCAEQQEKETFFLVEIMLMPGLTEITVTFKWIVNSLLYDNGHVLFIELFKYTVHQFCEHDHTTATSDVTTASTSSHYAPRPTLHQASAPREEVRPTLHEVPSYSPEPQEEDLIPVLEYLTENPTIEPAKFEQLWAGATEIGSISAKLESIPDKEDVITVFLENRLGCLASGSVQNFIKFFFYGEMLELQCLLCMEMVVDTDSGAVTGTVKRFAFQARAPEEEEQIDASFVDFLEKTVESL